LRKEKWMEMREVKTIEAVFAGDSHGKHTGYEIERVINGLNFKGELRRSKLGKSPIGFAVLRDGTMPGKSLLDMGEGIQYMLNGFYSEGRYAGLDLVLLGCQVDMTNILLIMEPEERGKAMTTLAVKLTVTMCWIRDVIGKERKLWLVGPYPPNWDTLPISGLYEEKDYYFDKNLQTLQKFDQLMEEVSGKCDFEYFSTMEIVWGQTVDKGYSYRRDGNTRELCKGIHLTNYGKRILANKLTEELVEWWTMFWSTWSRKDKEEKYELMRSPQEFWDQGAKIPDEVWNMLEASWGKG
jgi:hypothetical protein